MSKIIATSASYREICSTKKETKKNNSSFTTNYFSHIHEVRYNIGSAHKTSSRMWLIIIWFAEMQLEQFINRPLLLQEFRNRSISVPNAQTGNLFVFHEFFMNSFYDMIVYSLRVHLILAHISNERGIHIKNMTRLRSSVEMIHSEILEARTETQK